PWTHSFSSNLPTVRDLQNPERNRSLFTPMFADRLRHLEHAQSGFSKDWFQLFIGYDLTPLLWVLQFVLFDVGPHLFATCGRDMGAADPSTSANCGEGLKSA
ncbi:MAG TPA: hypothetical protein VK579_02960, partial [Terriglobales bacterium]|nr:hypothetical protein [Terriglobales bacterium]